MGKGHGDRVRQVLANKKGGRSWRPTIVITTKFTPSNGDIKWGKGVANRVRQVLATKKGGTVMATDNCHSDKIYA
jgi:hypothetical protein